MTSNVSRENLCFLRARLMEIIENQHPDHMKEKTHTDYPQLSGVSQSNSDCKSNCWNWPPSMIWLVCSSPWAISYLERMTYKCPSYSLSLAEGWRRLTEIGLGQKQQSRQNDYHGDLLCYPQNEEEQGEMASADKQSQSLRE